MLVESIAATHGAVPGSGIGIGSCNAVIEYIADDGAIDYAYGNSVTGLAGVHAELSAVAEAMDRGDLTHSENITRIYVELSPCNQRCRPALQNIAPNATVLYKYGHLISAMMILWKKEKCENVKNGFTSSCSAITTILF